MHHALAVPTQNGGSHPGGGGVRRLSIDAESTRVDLVLSAATPIGLLIPPIVDVLTRSSGFRASPHAVRYQLAHPGGTALDPSKTLAQSGIRDGAALFLTCSRTELMAPRFDDEAEAVSESVSVMESCWTRRSARLVGLLVTTWLAGVAATVLKVARRSSDQMGYEPSRMCVNGSCWQGNLALTLVRTAAHSGKAKAPVGFSMVVADNVGG